MKPSSVLPGIVLALTACVFPYARAVTNEDRAAIDRSLDDLRHGRLATDEQVAAVFNRYRRP